MKMEIIGSDINIKKYKRYKGPTYSLSPYPYPFCSIENSFCEVWQSKEVTRIQPLWCVLVLTGNIKL